MGAAHDGGRWALDPAEAARLQKEAKAFKGESLWTDARRRLRSNRAARLALWFLGLFGLLSIIAPLLPLPSPKALSLRTEAAAPRWPWQEPLPRTASRPGAPWPPSSAVACATTDGAIEQR